jgi:L-ascorbate metabolism protein UlaG (beta-lactamase superfamily)
MAVADDVLTLTLIGGPTVLVETGGLRLLTDPTFDEPGSYEAGGIVLTKHTSPAVMPDSLGAIDAVLLSHDQHFDNLDRAGRAFLPRAKRVLTTVAGAVRLGEHAQGLGPWESTLLPMADGRSLRVTATPARHGPVGIEPISGDVTGFVLAIGDGSAIYISGDTVWYEGVAEVARRFAVKLAILFTGSAQPLGPFHLTMDSNDAIEAAHAFAYATIVAVHNEGWAHFTQTQEDLGRAFAALRLTDRLQFLERGSSVSLEWN